jgi:hypothetical protein
MIGGIFTSFILELLVYPGIYQIWKWNFDMKGRTAPTLSEEPANSSTPAKREWVETCVPAQSLSAERGF